MGETNSHSGARVGYDISPHKRVKFKWLVVKIFNLTLFEWKNIVTHGQLKGNLHSSHYYGALTPLSQWWKNL